MSARNDGPLRGARLSTLAALCDAMIPRGGPFPLGAADVDLATLVNQHLAAFTPATQRQIGWLLRTWEYSTVLSSHVTPFSRLPSADREQFVVAAAHSPYPWRRIPLLLLAQLCGLAYGSAPQVEAAFGFSHTCIHTDSPTAGPRLTPQMYPDLHGQVDVRADVCIIGSGAGGAVVAKELAESGRSVVIIEEGDYFTEADFRGAPFARVLRTYRDQATTMTLGRPLIPLPLGKAVGGSTVINSGTCFRTPDTVLQRWVSEYGLEGYEPPTLAPIFERVERTINVMPVPWDIIGRNAELFDRGVRALGLHGAPIQRNIRGCRGCGVCAFGCPSDAKQAMHLSYLPQAERRGARIFARCRVDRLLIEKGRAIGAEADILDRPGDTIRGRLRVRADIVVVAAGTIHTPLLLRANGIGRRSGQLGRNLRLHPALAIGAHFDEDVHAWRGTLQSYFVDDLMASDEVMIEVTNPLPAMSLASGRAVGQRAKEVLAGYTRLASAGLFVSDTSSGRVVQLTRHGRPLMRYTLNAHDARRLIRGAALVAEIFLAAGARHVDVGLPGMHRVCSSADLAALRTAERWKPSALSPTSFHPMGTCRMGPDPKRSVVDPRGQMHDVERLFVADGSLFPTCAGVNPQVSIMAFATRIAQHIAAM